ncbi:diguanylate cyclase (GGDEF)-like protein [Deinobacterium chartae]|uniref:Diguanylate cyclase (GGDEF)-like protein n=1 Tax=Deinobacterium chartae TaxID=521158 RepID=A0A841I3N4_9DEIO|nr:diguanylate cyclase [Deinobacterium chartae]MBB6098988.1 diguanylate cyclase (GGDEF)-like protein [Deinobacterium chartae]
MLLVALVVRAGLPLPLLLIAFMPLPLIAVQYPRMVYLACTLLAGMALILGMRITGTEPLDALLVGVLVTALAGGLFDRLARGLRAREAARGALSESEHRLRAALEANMDAFVIYRAVRTSNHAVVDFEILELNAAAARMLPLPRDGGKGARLRALAPHALHAELFYKYRRVLESGVPLEEEYATESVWEGSVWKYQQVVPLDDGVAVTARDVTGRKRAEQQLALAVHRAQALAQVARLSTEALNLEEIVTRAVQAVAEVADVDFGCLLTGRWDRVVAQACWRSPGAGPELEQLGSRMPYVAEMLQQALQGGWPLYWDDLLTHSEAAPGAQPAISGVCLFPLDPERALLFGRSGAVRPWSAEDRALLEVAAQNVRVMFERTTYLQGIEAAARRDPLTGLGNRRAFDEEATAEMARFGGSRQGNALGLMLMDLDGLKAVNDLEGHARGDALLQAFANALIAAVRTQDRVYRIGGDEFVVLMPNCMPEGGRRVAEAVRRAAADLRRAGFAPAGVSVGVAFCPSEADTLDHMMHLADERMYAEKRHRKQPVSAAGGTDQDRAGLDELLNS